MAVRPEAKELGRSPVNASDYQLFFDKDIPPVMTVKPGQVFSVDTPDCACGLIRSRNDLIISANDLIERLGGLNYLVGPIWIEDVEAGDVLKVTLVDIEPAPATKEGFVALAPGFGALVHDNGFGVQPSLASATTICSVDRKRVLVPLKQGAVSLPCEPLVGCIGVAPKRERRMTLSQSPDYVGDIDLPQFKAGSSLLMRANHEGGLLSLGDVHATQGDGEFSGFAVEVEARITLRVDVIKGSESLLGNLPALADAERVGVVAAFQGTSTARCLQACGADLADLLGRVGIELPDALQLLSVAAKARIGNAFEPFYSVFTYLSREHLPVELPDQFDVAVH